MKKMMFVGVMLIQFAICAKDNIEMVSMMRTACKGNCPVYMITFDRNGETRWIGESHVKRKGFFAAQMPIPEVRKLLAPLQGSAIKQLKRRYGASDSHQSHLIFVFTIDGELIRIENAEAGPLFLRKLAMQMDMAAAKLKWKEIRFTPPVIEDQVVEKLPQAALLTRSDVAQEGVAGDLAETRSQNSPVSTAETIVDYAEEMPEFPGGQVALNNYLRTHIRYPEAAREAGVSGKVICRFVVEETGEISHVETLRGVGAGLEQEAMRVIRNMPKWKPGRINNRPVKVYFRLPVNFVLK